MRTLPKNLIQEVLKVNPIAVEYEFDYPKLVRCTIENDKGVGIGISICSISEEAFDFRQGKIRALGRAKKALCTQGSSCGIRPHYRSFPRSWSKRQIDRVLEFAAYGYKSEFIPA